MTYAEECDYWKTSNAAPDSWLEKSIGLIEKFGGKVISSGYGHENTSNRSSYMIRFTLDGETFRIVWPVLESEHGDFMAARRQASTMLYHDIKAKCVSAQVLGARLTFFSWLELPDGTPIYRLASQEIVDAIPEIIGGRKLLTQE